jgi:oxygen-independent coproporphyrinogen III oxidase
MNTINKKLIEKYNTQAPRYTSYPTVPYWDPKSFSSANWIHSIRETFVNTNDKHGVSIYIHLPFCESLCTYCGCNTRITVNHKVEEPYLEAVLKEWQLYKNIFGDRPKIREIHLGGGTPTFFSAENLERLLESILFESEIMPDHSFSFEAHPNNTSIEHLQTLYKLGFTRLSLGIQDFNPEVQKIVNRIQNFETVKQVTEQARNIGYTSINYDLIYGLPLQTQDTVIDTIEKVKLLTPDRIALYSYAHVPWIKPGQRKFTELDLPTDERKRSLYEIAKQKLIAQDYREIGLDHFALPDDDLYKAYLNKSLHRNFMGYTVAHTQLLVGLGVSSISDSFLAFSQNVKMLEEYYRRINLGELPILKGHILTEADIILRKHILKIMCQLETSWHLPSEQCEELYLATRRLKEMENDGLLIIEPDCLKVTEAGGAFIRNICMALDARLWADKPTSQLFSSAI